MEIAVIEISMAFTHKQPNVQNSRFLCYWTAVLMFALDVGSSKKNLWISTITLTLKAIQKKENNKSKSW